MDEYLIGAGALLTAGPSATIRSATLHAQAEPALARRVRAALFDFESGRPEDLAQALIVAAGWSGHRFREEVVGPLLAQRECALADVLATLADAVGTGEVHLFARWQPDSATLDALRSRGVRIESHPLEAIGQAALISGQRVERWQPGRAA
ncbi:MAG TPA: hypothetical protein VGX91_07705 [Candidatus Cybelea sp.]|jgi:hypothetical protein|nr:hypothetical protein [Candidatus Cybelea sp.]